MLSDVFWRELLLFNSCCFGRVDGMISGCIFPPPRVLSPEGHPPLDKMSGSFLEKKKKLRKREKCDKMFLSTAFIIIL